MSFSTFLSGNWCLVVWPSQSRLRTQACFRLMCETKECLQAEELPFADGVYSPAGREKLHSKLCCLSCNDFVAFFTTDPLVLTVGCVNRRPFLIDTNPVSLSPGRGNGLILVGEGNSPEVWMSLCTWIWQTGGQSLVLLSPETK